MFAVGVAVLVVVAKIVTVVVVTEAPVSREDPTADGSRGIGCPPGSAPPQTGSIPTETSFKMNVLSFSKIF